MKALIQLLSLLAIGVSQCGCMTTIATSVRIQEGTAQGAYFGTRGEAEFVRDLWFGTGVVNAGPRRWTAVVAVLDLPFTVVSDTLFLPVDLPILRRRHKKESEKKEGTNNTPEDICR
jgi:uncharacterized protein YceK